MRSHNHLLHEYPGCDGLKTGFINAGGFSIVATAQKNGRRVIAVVLGSKDRKVRDAKAMELLSKGFAALPPLPPPPPPVVVPVVTNLPVATGEEALPGSETPHMGWLKIAGIGLAIGLVVLGIGSFFMKKRSRNDF
jgi:D-alanyl-D-alanine carboxypeptidase (penicillin-binding protein 5/6)